MITEKCDICGMDVAPAKNHQQLLRNIALHKRAKHGIAGKHNARYRHERAIKMAGGAKAFRQIRDTGPIYETSQMPEQHMGNNDTAKEVPLPTAEERHYRRNKRNETAVEPAYLSECPQCHARFYVAKGQV